jgi:hypothetical protein
MDAETIRQLRTIMLALLVIIGCLWLLTQRGQGFRSITGSPQRPASDFGGPPPKRVTMDPAEQY